MRCGEKWILKHMAIVPKRERIEKQIDYVFVSNRWRSSVIDARVRWGPSMHRNIKGKDDHALVSCTWSWRLRAVKPNKGVDWSALRTLKNHDADTNPANGKGGPFPVKVGLLQDVDAKASHETTAMTTTSATCEGRERGLSLISNQRRVTATTSARVCEYNTPNLAHVIVRDGHPKNGGLLMTQLPNAPKLNSHTRRVPSIGSVPTEGLLLPGYD